MKIKKLEKLSNLKLRTRTKVLIPVLIAFILLSSAILVAVPSYKFGTDPSGNSWGGSINATTNSNNRCWESTASGLQSAIDNLNSTDGGIVEMGNDITTTATIYLNDNVTLDLCGHTLSMQAGTNENLIENYDNSTGNSHIVIINGVLDGIDTTLNAGKSGVKLVNVTHCKIVDVVVYNAFWGIALYEGSVSASNEYNEIRGCLVDWCNSGIIIDGNYNTVDICHVYNSTGFAFYARKSTIGHNLWTNIHGYGVQSGSPTGVGLGIAEYDSQYQIVIGGSFYGNYPEDCVHITSKGGNCTISNIVVHNTHASADGIYSSGKHVKFDSCVAYSCGGRGFEIAGEHTTLDNIKSYNNDKEGILFGTASDHSSCVNSEIFNNSQDGAGTYGNINIYQPDNISIHNCDIYDTSATVQYGIKEGGTTDYNFFTDNNLYGTFTVGTAYIIGSNTVVRNNEGYDYDSLRDDKIWNSNGHYYPATESGLQDAINNLNNESGWVDGGNNNISISNSIYIGKNLDLSNLKLYLADSANETMITSYSGGCENSYLHDIILDGNNENQPVWWHVGDRSIFAHGIYLVNFDYGILENINVSNTQSSGIIIDDSEFVTVDKCTVLNAASGYITSGHTHWWSKAIMLWYCNNSIITNCFTNNSYAGGIVFEADAEATHASNGIISDCYVGFTEYGFYIEDADNVTISNCIAESCTYNEVYGGGGGFRTHDSYDVTITAGSRASKCKNGIAISSTGIRTTINSVTSNDNTQYGLYNAGDYTTITDTTFKNNPKHIYSVATATDCSINDNRFNDANTYAVEMYGEDFTLNNNHFYDTGDYCIVVQTDANNYSIQQNFLHDISTYGIETLGDNGLIIGNHIGLTGNFKRAIRLNSAFNISVVDNFIDFTGTNGFGVEETGTSDYNKIRFNDIIDAATPITITGSNSYAMFVNASTAMMGIQNTTGTYWK
jgi:parallel beta-helix repeat protein